MFDYKNILLCTAISSALASTPHGLNLRRTNEVLATEGCTYITADTQYERGQMPTGSSHSDGCVLSNGELVQINGLTNAFKASYGNDLVSGESIIQIDGAPIKDGVLTVPDKAEISIISMKDPVFIGNMIGATSTTKKVLVIRADTPNESTTSDIDQLSDDMFGTGNDPINLKSQFKACSYDALQFEPVIANFNGHDIAAGVGEVSLSTSTNGQDRYDAMNAMINAANAKYGSLSTKISNGELDYVMLCVPPNTAGSWVAYAYINSYISVYNNQWCSMVSAQMHEIGHNLGLAHSGETSSYDDQSGLMGYSYSSDDSPIMCFNAAKNWQLGWYPNGQRSISPLEASSESKSFVGYLIGLADYDLLDTTSSDKVIIQITGYTSDYYVSYNRKTGINSGTFEGGNQVLVHSRATGQGYATSIIVAKLSSGGTYAIGSGNDATTIKVNSINTSATPSFADVEIVGSSTDAPVTPPTTAPVTPPTTAPVTPPTTAPVTPPTTAPFTSTPITVPTMYPTHKAPTMYPTHKAPTPYPTEVPPTPYPTEKSCAVLNEPCKNNRDCCKKKCNKIKGFCRR